MWWFRSQLFWRTLIGFAILSLLPLAGLLLTLNSQLETQAEENFCTEVRKTTAAIQRDVDSAGGESALAHWRNAIAGRPVEFWLVDIDGRDLSHSDVPVPQRPAVRSILLSAFQFGHEQRWIEEYETHRPLYFVAVRCHDGADGVRILLARGTPSPELTRERFASQISTRAAVFTWLASILCVGVICAGLVYPLRAMTRNLEVDTEELQRRDMLLRISDRHDELGHVAQSLSILEAERKQQFDHLKLADLQSRTTVDLLSAILEAMVEGVIAVDESERILFINTAARKLLSVGSVI
ncbi:MAG: PAS domain-containing protein, partial [Planctomycetaceae bacterium]|nr:PAS domain-containing protein [Planctomycetaceae bacterium]